MQQRIDRLEKLVKDMASQSQQENSHLMPSFPETDEARAVPNTNIRDGSHALRDIQHGVGVMKVSDNQNRYRGSTHWGDVFQEVGWTVELS